MHQPDLPAPPSRRPDTASLLLEAVSRRQTQECLALVQQWVHRRGITDLRQFCAHDLRSQQGESAAAWLLDLLDRDAADPDSNAGLAATDLPGSEDSGSTPTTPIHAFTETPAAKTLRTISAVEPGAAERSDFTAAAEPALESPSLAGAAEQVLEQPPQFTSEALAETQKPHPLATALAASLQNRAEEAVDAAFAALAETFADVERSTQALGPQATAPAIPQAPAPEALVPPPAPIPPSGGVWPSASHSAMAVASALQAQALAAQSGIAPPAEAGGGADPGRETLSADQEVTRPASPQPEEDLSRGIPSIPGPGVLIARLRQRLSQQRLPQLSHLRAVMRDCVDETMALLRGADTEDVDLEDEFPPATGEQTKVPAWNPPAGDFSATMLPTPVPAATPGAAWSSGSPQAEPAPRQPGSPPPAEPPVTRAARLRRDLLQRRGGTAADRPAPAPSSLSDLCGWLPERDDLPRAS